MSIEELLPFQVNELILDNIHKPIVQKLGNRDSSRGGGLVVYANKSLRNESDLKRNGRNF